MLKAVLFDMDGVLIDSEPEYRRIEEKLYRKIGIAPTEEDIRGNAGKKNIAMWKQYKGKFCFPDDPVDIAAEEALQARAFYERGDLRQIEPSAALLKCCAGGGLKVALATSSLKENAKIVLARLGLEEYVDVIASGDSIRRSKPAPDIFLAAAKMLGVAPCECVVIEDAENGVKAAKAAGMKVVGLQTAASNQDLSMADIVVDSLHKINVETLCSLLDR